MTNFSHFETVDISSEEIEKRGCSNWSKKLGVFILNKLAFWAIAFLTVATKSFKNDIVRMSVREVPGCQGVTPWPDFHFSSPYKTFLVALV